MNANIEAGREQDKDGKIPLDLVDHWINDYLVEVLALDPDVALIDNKKHLNTCLPHLAVVCDLSSIVITSSKHPLHACIELCAALMVFSRQMRSKDLRLADAADERSLIF